MRFPLILLLLSAAPVAADVTPEQLWAEWQRLALQSGSRLAAETRREGDRLILDRPALQTIGDVGISELRTEQMVLQDNGDGTVSVLMPERFTLMLDVPVKRSDMTSEVLAFAAWAPGLDIRVGGLGDNLDFTLLAPSLSLMFDPAQSIQAPGATATVNFAVADLTLTHVQAVAQDSVSVTSTLSLGTLHADAQIAGLGPGDGRIEMSADLSAVSALAEIYLDLSRLAGADLTPAQALSALPEGEGAEISFQHGPLALSLVMDDAIPGPERMQLSSDGGMASARFDRTGSALSVDKGRTGLVAAINEPGIPLSDLDLSFVDLGFSAQMDVTGANDPLGFGVTARLTDLAASPSVWASFDPGEIFPRDPLSLSIGLSGLMADRADTAPPDPLLGETAPVDILAFALDDLLLSGLGAKLTGSGELTFDPTDRVTFDGFPLPDGALSFTATGLNGLIERFVSAGLVPQADLTGLRFGLAFIAKPGEGPDTLNTRIEFTDKSLYLNGIKMR